MWNRNKYLDDLGIKKENYGSNFIKERKIQRFIERRKYGFDYKETVNMNLIFAEWIYSRLMMLTEQTMDDLSYNTVDFECNTYTIQQAYQRILDATKEYLCFYEIYGSHWDSSEDAEKIQIEMKAAIRLWANVMEYADITLVSKRALRRLTKDEQ